MEKSIRILVVAAASLFALQAWSASPTESVAEIGSWLDGIPTNFVSEVFFDDVGFNRYLPVNNPYQVVAQELAALPPEKVDEALSRYGTGIPGSISPFYSRTAKGGRPQSGLFQNADYQFKSSCAACPERASFHRDGLSLSFKRAAGAKDSNYVFLKFSEISAEHFATYPYLRELFEVQTLMLDPHNSKSYVFRREKSLHHGGQAVLDFANSSPVEKSDWTKKKLAELAALSLNDRIKNQISYDVRNEAAVRDSPMAIGSHYDPHPYQSISGKHVLMRAILDSIFDTGETQEKGKAVVENYRVRNAYASYLFAEFQNRNRWWPRELGPRPRTARAYAWWNEMPQWFSNEPLRAAEVTCESMFVPAH